MNEKECLEVVRGRLDGCLDFGLDYDLRTVHSDDTLVIIITVDTEGSTSWGDDWEDKLEELVRSLSWELDAWYSWKGWRICIHLVCVST